MKKLLFSAVIILILFFLIKLAFLPVDPFSEKEVFFEVERGQGSKKISLNLEKENLIRWAPLFRFYVLAEGIAGKLKAGEYLLSPSMDITRITEKLFRGDTVKKRITIIEGWNLKDIGLYFEAKGMFQAEEVWLTAAKDFSSELDFLKEKPETLEGYLFPDTYEIEKNESLEDIFKKMLKNFDRKLESLLKEEIENQARSVSDVVIMASLIEKEVKALEDKKLVSGILWKRLETNMPLQVDATIAYILNGQGWTFDEMRREIALGKDIDSPYNTYKYLGLPSGPIANPGTESIKAAIYPEKSDYWYYLSTPGGETVFSRTLQEHNAARAEYFK